MYNFVTAGNDCPQILKFNLERLKTLYPSSSIFLYDWGHKTKDINRFKKVNSNLIVISWPQANSSNFMYQKVVCINDCFIEHDDKPLIYLDSDVIVYENIDEIFDDTEWDIAATWRPEFQYKAKEFGVGAWLNAGVLFINNRRVEHSLQFLKEWLVQCGAWEQKDWWLDQVELIKLFAVASNDLSLGANRKGTLMLNDKKIILRTLHYTIYNFLPEMPIEYTEYEPSKTKIFHLKSPWRKIKFNLMSDALKKKWLDEIKKDENDLFKKLNYAVNQLVRAIYNAIPLSKHFLFKLLRFIRNRTVYFLNWRKYTEIYYWKSKKDRVGDLYSHEIKRSRCYYDLFSSLFKINICRKDKVLEVGPGPIGGILDLIECDEKWAVEPIYSKYKKRDIWFPRSEVIMRETTCEKMINVPDNYFDFVFTMNAIDHGNDIRKCFEKVHSVLKESAIFYLHVHCRKKEQSNKLHRQSFNEHDLTIWLENTGFSIIKSKLFDTDPVPQNRYNTFVGVMRKEETKKMVGGLR